MVVPDLFDELLEKCVGLDTDVLQLLRESLGVEGAHFVVGDIV
jgi:hypothetical protein